MTSTFFCPSNFPKGRTKKVKIHFRCLFGGCALWGGQHKYLLLLFILINVCFLTNTLAQGNTLIVGEVKNPSKNYLQITLDKTYLNNTIEEELVGIREDGKFGVTAVLELPQLLTLRYNNKEVQLFIEPEDTLVLKIDGQLFPFGLQFEGRAAANNQALRAFNTQFPEDRNQFHFRQYLKGLHYYKIHSEYDKVMRAKTPVEFVDDLRREQMDKRQFLQNWQAQKGLQISPALQKYLQGDLYYDYLYKQMAYGDIYQGRHGLDSSFFYFVDTLSHFEDLALANPKYREFLMAWVNFQTEQEGLPDSLDNKYFHQYYYAKTQLNGFSRYMVMAYLVKKAFQKITPEQALPIYRDFLGVNPYLEFDRIAADAFQKTQQFAVGSPAPTFSLQDLDGNYVSLRDFQGEVVYLDFWASWCRPCMKKLQKLKAIERQLKDQNVVFLHVNLDKSPVIWRNTVQKQQFEGLHLYNTSASSITKDYEVLSVPKFFVITKEGNFAFTPASSDEAMLLDTLQKLLN